MEHLTSNKAKKNVCLGVTMCYPIIAIYFGKWWKMKITSGASRFSIISRQTHLETPVLLTFGNLGVSQFTLRLSKPMGRWAAGPCQRTPAGRRPLPALSAPSAPKLWPLACEVGATSMGAELEKIKSMAPGCTFISMSSNEAPVVLGWTKQQEWKSKTMLSGLWSWSGPSMAVQNTTIKNYWETGNHRFIHHLLGFVSCLARWFPIGRWGPYGGYLTMRKWDYLGNQHLHGIPIRVGFTAFFL